MRVAILHSPCPFSQVWSVASLCNMLPSNLRSLYSVSFSQFFMLKGDTWRRKKKNIHVSRLKISGNLQDKRQNACATQRYLLFLWVELWTSGSQRHEGEIPCPIWGDGLTWTEKKIHQFKNMLWTHPVIVRDKEWTWETEELAKLSLEFEWT